jgi:hypothetical protein
MKLQGRTLLNGNQGDDVRLLHQDLAVLGFRNIPDGETGPGVFGPDTLAAVRELQQGAGLRVTGVVDEPTARAIEGRVASLRPAVAEPPPATYLVTGTVTSSDHAGVGGLNVVVVDKTVGPDVTLATAATEPDGSYEARFAASVVPAGKARPDLQARVFTSPAPGAAATFLAASEVRYNASPRETLDVTLPAGAVALPSEHETLTAALSANHAGNLKDLQESADRQDITYLANKTGWDARAVAMAALAERLHAEVAPKDPTGAFPPALFYALFRAGLPTDPEALYQTGLAAVGTIWQQGIDRGVIPQALAPGLPAALEIFHGLAAEKAPGSRALAGASTLQEMLHLSLGDDAQRQQKFADLYARHRDDLPALWTEVAKQPAQGGLGPEVAARLQLDGQLFRLTLNNAKAIGLLHAAQSAPLTSTLDLALRGYHRADRWVPLLQGTAVPDAVPGATPAEKLANYAEHVAAQVRLSHPTAVVAERVQSKAFPLGTDDANVKGVYDFLTAQVGKFEIGLHPVEQYLAHNPALKVPPPVVEQVKKLQRVFQLTPSDDAMSLLLQHNLDSAFKLVRSSAEDLVRRFGAALGEDQVRKIHAKARQVHAAVLNVATSYLTARRAARLGATASFLDPEPPAPSPLGPVAQATLETLFGSMDFCACDECRSILGPAAYLVDLLLFLDPTFSDPTAWNAFLADWQTAHRTQYPFPDDAAFQKFKTDWTSLHPGQTNLPETRITPLAVLLNRRPDIQYLPLTCENTNTPLPYVDLVNETLEYFVVTQKGSLAGYHGHDTGAEASAAELLANPQFVLSAAYDNYLENAVFPTPLPFHRALEALRRHFVRFGVTLSAALAALRTDDAIDRSGTPGAYVWRDVQMERMGLSRPEHALLTDGSTLQQLYGYDSNKSSSDVRSALANVKAFSRRIGVTYLDLIEILKTRFVNPNSDLIPKLERLGVPFATLKKLKDSGTAFDAAFDQLLPPDLDLAQYGGDVKAWVKKDANYARIMGLIVLTNPNAKTTADLAVFDQLELHYSNPEPTASSLHELDYVRLLRFIRLWRKLGWTIADTDRSITALYPAADLPAGSDDAGDRRRLNDGFGVLVSRLGFVVDLLARLGLQPERDLASLLALWSPIDTHGSDSLYSRIFLSRTLLKRDAAFADDGYGNFLSKAGEPLLAHAETLRAACNLTGDELAQILADLGFSADTVPPPPLTLDNVSAVYRRGWLARQLRLSVRELLLLVRWMGLQPFDPPDLQQPPDPPDPNKQSVPPDLQNPPSSPYPPIVLLVGLVEALRAASLQPVEALYLLWNQDLSGTSAPRDAEVTAFARTLRADFAAIESQYAVVDEPTARDRLTQVYGADDSGFFFGVLDNTFSVDVSYVHPQDTLEPSVVTAGFGQIAYDRFQKRLSFSDSGGVMTLAIRDAIKAAYTGPSTVTGADKDKAVKVFQDAVDSLYAAHDRIVGAFFVRHPDLKGLYSSYTASSDLPEKRRATLLAGLLPGLQEQRKRQQALAAAGAAVHVDGTFAKALLDDPSVLSAAGNQTTPTSALGDLIAIGTLSPIPAGSWSGYVEAPESGFYDLSITADAAATVKLSVDGAAVNVAPNGNVWTNLDPIQLSAGTVVLKVEVAGQTTQLGLSWETRSRGREQVPARYLYPVSLVDPLRGAYVRFLKLASLATALRLTANEIAYLAANPDFQVGGQGWANALAVAGDPDKSNGKAWRNVLATLLDFARWKAALAPNDERLLAVLRAPAATLPNGDSLLRILTGWDHGSLPADGSVPAQSALGALLTRFGYSLKNLSDLTHLARFRRVYEAYAVVTKLRIPAAALLAAVTNDPGSDTVAQLQAALCARYAKADWLNVVKPINDELRGLQRDALVAYVLHALASDPTTSAIDTSDKLFEYLLMDVEMDPCMQTSRVRHALSAVQLFIQRCLMSLEAGVAASVIDAKKWEWMKRYRVWQANREVFLYPENWLYPELRDDASPIFKETMSELLQSDVTDDSAAAALVNYLSKLEEVAKLEPCGIHYVEPTTASADGVSHVVARTAGAHRKHYYRRRESGSWTPWEKIPLDIEDHPVLPVVWNGRLLLFWLRILKTTPFAAPNFGAPSQQDPDPLLTSLRRSNIANQASNLPGISVQAVLNWSEYYDGKWHAVKTSDPNRPLELGIYPPGVDPQRSWLLVEAHQESESDGSVARLRVNLRENGDGSFLLYNTHSLPEPSHWVTDPAAIKGRMLYENPLAFVYWPGDIYRMVLGAMPLGYRFTQPMYHLDNPWDAPFFYEDSRHVFYVSTTEKSVQIANASTFGVLPAASRIAGAPALVRVVPANGSGAEVRLAAGSRVGGLDANLGRRPGAIASVRFGDLEIGPKGALAAR